MPSIKIPESELSDMKQFYEAELEKTVKRLQHIKNVLDELGGSASSIDIRIITKGTKAEGSTLSTGKKRGRPAGSANPSGYVKKLKSEKQKPGRKSVWETVVINRLRELDKPVTYDELTTEIMTFSNLPEAKRQRTKIALLNVSFRLRNKDKKINTFSAGFREKYVGLTEWFDNKGKIKPEYSSKVVEQPLEEEVAPIKAEKLPKAKIVKIKAEPKTKSAKPTKEAKVAKTQEAKTAKKPVIKKPTVKLNKSAKTNKATSKKATKAAVKPAEDGATDKQ